MEGNATKNVVPELTGQIFEVPLVDSSLSKEGYSADAKKTGDELAKRVLYTDVIDNMTTDDATKPLSAKQGVVIKKQLDSLSNSQASGVGYSNKNSGLSATNMQTAIDEVVDRVKSSENEIDTLATKVDDFSDDFLPKNGGGMINGQLQVQNANNGYGGILKNNSASADYGTQIYDVSKDGKQVKVSMSAELGTLNFVDTSGNIRNIFHDGNKPFSNYTGNGSATTRTISTNGIGRLLMVYCSSHIAFVTPKGALVVELATTSISWLDAAKAYYLNGNLMLGTANAAFNASNETYYYQVI